uniref:Uncharacterized protein n=1 Tax=Bionectria ochroleuca TaxID=29856 RepID=A0A8H7MZ65_BIOOC
MVARSVLGRAQRNAVGWRPVGQLGQRSNDEDVLSWNGGHADVEGRLGIARGWRRAHRGHGIVCGLAPGRWDDTAAALDGCEEGGVRPGQVCRRSGRAIASGILLSKGAAGGSVLLDDGDEVVSVSMDGADDCLVRGRPFGVCSCGSRGNNILEEGEVDRIDGERTNLVPLVDGRIELLSGSKGSQIPWVASIVNILGVAADGCSLPLSDTAVNGVDGAEGVDNSLVVCQSPGRAGLES